MRKTIGYIIIIIVIFTLTACKPQEIDIDIEPFTIEAGREIFIDNGDYDIPLTLSESVDIGRYEIEEININNNLIVYSKPIEISDYYKQYAIKSINNDSIIPLTYTSQEQRVYYSIEDNIIITHNNNLDYRVYDTEGNIILDDVQCDSIESIGQKYFRVNYFGGKTQLFDTNGNGVFDTPITYPIHRDTISSYDDQYILISSVNGHHSIINNSGTMIKSYIDTTSIKHNLYYLQEDTFLVIKNTYVEESSNYRIALDNDKYLNQSIYKYNAATNQETTEQIDVIYSFTNRYVDDSINNILKEGYNFISVYNTNDDKTINAQTPYRAFVINNDIKKLISIQDNLHPYITYKNEIGIEYSRLNASNITLRMIQLDGSVIWETDERVKTILGFNDQRIVVGASINNKTLYGAYDSEGNRVVDYQYDKLSVFVGGYAIGQVDDTFYRVDKQGNREELNQDIISFYGLYGLYIVNDQSTQLLYNNKGDIIIDSDYHAQDIKIINKANKVFVQVLDANSNYKVYFISLDKI